MSRSRFLVAFVVTVTVASLGGPATGQVDRAGPDSGLPSLREVYRTEFEIGVALGGALGELSEKERALLRSQFGSVTPENCLKMSQVQPREGAFEFGPVDALVESARGAGLKVVGHCLVWAKDERTPAWVFRDGDKPASRELLLSRLRSHIQAVVSRYRGRISTWDVVNEAISDDDASELRPSTWTSVLGEDLLVKSFLFAHEADPDARLILNDYNLETQPAKRERLLRVLGRLRQNGVPVHAVGLQGHFEIDAIPFTALKDTIASLRAMKVGVVISELDIDVIPRSRWWADGGKHREEMAKLDPYRDGCPPEVLKRQADQYAELFRFFRANADAIDRVTFWNLHDGRSWLNAFPWKRANHPLLFDRECRPKPAFWAVAGAGDFGR